MAATDTAATALAPAASSNQQDLPFDAISEILSRCSLDTVAKFRTTSHQFNNYTYETHFRRLHHRRNDVVSGFFLINYRSTTAFVSSSTSHNISLDFLPKPAKILAAATKEGVMLCSTEVCCHLPRYIIVKPATKQWDPIPNPKSRFETRHIGMLVLGSSPPLDQPRHHRFKIVRLSRLKYNMYKDTCTQFWCEVFDSERWRWKVLDEKVKLVRSGEYIESRLPVSARGSLHWLTDKGRVLAFDGGSERWESFPIPNRKRTMRNVRRHWFDTRLGLTEYQGKLGLVLINHKSCLIRLWVLENYSEKLWEMKFSVDMGGVVNELFRGVMGMSLGFCDADTIVFNHKYDSKIVLYNLRNGSMEAWDGLRGSLWSVFPLCSNFERCDFGRPEKKATCFKKSREERWKTIDIVDS
ncbi:F-box protein At5g41720 [Linum perenne]